MKAEEFLKRNNVNFKLIHLAEVPRSAKDVERIYGCSLHQVLKTLVFVSENKPVVAVLSGDKKVDVNKIKEIARIKILRIAKPEEVEAITGCMIGGVSPFGIDSDVIKIMDKSILGTGIVNIGSGKAEIGIELSSKQLRKVWNGIVADISV